MEVQVKYEGTYKDSRGRANGICVQGTEVTSGKEFKKFVPSFKKDVYDKIKDQVANIATGTVVNATLEKEGNFWNLVSVDPYSGAPAATADAPAAQASTAGPAPRAAASRGKHPRQIALESTTRIVETMIENGLLKKTSGPDVVASTTVAIAQTLTDFLLGREVAPPDDIGDAPVAAPTPSEEAVQAKFPTTPGNMDDVPF